MQVKVRNGNLNNSMESFATFFERRERNPLRKKELEPLGYDNKAYADFHVKEFEDNLPQNIKDTVGLLKIRDPQAAKEFLDKKKQEIASSHLRSKITPDYKKIMTKFGIQVFADPSVTEDVSPGTYAYKMIDYSIRHLVNDYRDILPNRKPRIVISDMKKNKHATGSHKTGEIAVAPGLYRDRLIYLDQYSLDNPDLLVHEYAHFVADRTPTQTEKILQHEYIKMLDTYFEAETGKPTRRKALEGLRNNKMRELVAKKLGLPTVYSATNFDEWFAEIISHWKRMPNNAHNYRFKKAMKSVLTRL